MKLIWMIAWSWMMQTTQAQNGDEWFHQKRTQKKYLLDQISALKVYIDYAQKGYEIARKGLSTIEHIKKGDFDLHLDHFNAMKEINPKIKNWTKVADIILYQVGIVRKISQIVEGMRESGEFTGEELDYCKNVLDNLLEECLKSIDDLMRIVTNNELEMTDNERIERIETIHVLTMDNYAFVSSLGKDMALLSIERMGEQVEVKRSELLNGK